MLLINYLLIWYSYSYDYWYEW